MLYGLCKLITGRVICCSTCPRLAFDALLYICASAFQASHLNFHQFYSPWLHTSSGFVKGAHAHCTTAIVTLTCLMSVTHVSYKPLLHGLSVTD